MKFLLPLHQTFDIQLVKLSKYRELIELALLSILSLAIPIFIGHPQIVVGIIANTLIVRTALTLKGWKNFPVIFLPSLGAFLRGVIFGPASIYLLYLIPFIWLGNFVLSYFVKIFSRSSFFVSVIIPSAIKAFVIFAPALFLVKTSIVPEIFLKAMGVTQLITAMTGCVIALGITKYESRKSKF